MPVPPPAIPPIPGTQLTGNDICKSALRLIGVLASGEEPTAAEYLDALSALNQMIDSLNAERLSLFQVLRQEFALTSAKQTYTLGIGGDLNIARPPKIDWAALSYTANPPQPLEIPIEYVTDPYKWRDITLKTLDSMFPVGIFDDQGFPFRTLTLWPIPNISTLKLVLYLWQALTQFPNGRTIVTFPPGYYEALRFNLAVRLAPEFQKPVSQDIAALAVESLARVRSANVPSLEMQCDDALLSASAGSSWVNFVSGK